MVSYNSLVCYFKCLLMFLAFHLLLHGTKRKGKERKPTVDRLRIAVVNTGWDVDNHSVHLLRQGDHGSKPALREHFIEIPVIFDHSGFGMGFGRCRVDTGAGDDHVIVSGGRTRPKDGFGPVFRVHNLGRTADGHGPEFHLVGLAGLVERFSDNAIDLSSGTTGINNGQADNLVKDGGSGSTDGRGRLGSGAKASESEPCALSRCHAHQSVAGQSQSHCVVGFCGLVASSSVRIPFRPRDRLMMVPFDSIRTVLVLVP
mmetsp:Transcript_9017/g.21950  ORF Transcript_9017/g.21950 Transcript_9017/m.21950 type:complete len:258 (+) Transcript_9017:23-796(+)